MSEPLSYHHIEEGLRAAINLQSQLTEDFAVLGDELALAESAFKKAWAQARIQYRDDMTGQRINEDKVADAASMATTKEYEAKELAKVKHESTKQRLYSVRERMNAMRSLMISHRVATGDVN